MTGWAGEEGGGERGRLRGRTSCRARRSGLSAPCPLWLLRTCPRLSCSGGGGMGRVPCAVQHPQDGARVGGPGASLCSWKSPCPTCPRLGLAARGAGAPAGGQRRESRGRQGWRVCRMTSVVTSSPSLFQGESQTWRGHCMGHVYSPQVPRWPGQETLQVNPACEGAPLGPGCGLREAVGKCSMLRGFRGPRFLLLGIYL